MADSKVSALSALTTPVSADEFLIVSAGVSRKVTMANLLAYIKSRDAIHNASVASQGAGFASDTYLTGSNCLIPASSLKAGTMYRCKFNAVKTGAGVATPIINVRVGTAATTSDTSRGTLTFAAQTAAADEAVIETFTTFRTVGSGTTAVIQTLGMIDHRLAATGFSTANTSIQIATSGGFDSTVASLQIGLSVNGGTSAAWTVSLVQAELFNLA